MADCFLYFPSVLRAGFREALARRAPALRAQYGGRAIGLASRRVRPRAKFALIRLKFLKLSSEGLRAFRKFHGCRSCRLPLGSLLAIFWRLVCMLFLLAPLHAFGQPF